MELGSIVAGRELDFEVAGGVRAAIPLEDAVGHLAEADRLDGVAGQCC
jgi:hypothetical protein